MEPELSIIIPVYNAEKFLGICIDSVLSQKFQNFEIILINDGSKDNSAVICDVLASKNEKIKVFHQKNKGVSAARNLGIVNASGKFIGFVDADDWIGENFYNNLMNSSEEHGSEITVADYQEQNGKDFINHSAPFSKNVLLERKEIELRIFPEMIRKESMNSACNKIFKRELINRYNIKFPINRTFGEDAHFVREAVSKTKDILFILENGYFYRENIGSASRDLQNKNYLAYALEHYNDSFDMFPKMPATQVNKLKSLRLAENLQSHISVVHQSNLNSQIKKKLTQEILRNKQLQEVLKNYWNEIIDGKNKFSKFLLNCMRYKNYFLLKSACTYANYKNKKQ